MAGPAPGGAYCSSCWLLKPQFERRSLILPPNQTDVNLGRMGVLPCQQTLPAKAERSAKLTQLRDLEAEMALVGVLEGRVGGVGSRRRRGTRSPKNPRKPNTGFIHYLQLVTSRQPKGFAQLRHTLKNHIGDSA